MTNWDSSRCEDMQEDCEFDSFSEEVLGGMEDPLKRLIGGGGNPFISRKAAWLIRYLKELACDFCRQDGEKFQFLDFGCGGGELLQELRKQGLDAELTGCDVSKQMLTRARERWRTGKAPDFQLIHGNITPFSNHSFDVITVCCVLHHVAVKERPGVFLELDRVLKKNGLLVVFEHNPRNLITRWMVSRAAIDRNAILLDHQEVCRLMGSTGLKKLRSEHFLFFPPFLPGTSMADRLLASVPLGGQYVVVGEKSC